MKFKKFHTDVLETMREELLKALKSGHIMSDTETADAIQLSTEMYERLFRELLETHNELQSEYRNLANSYKELQERYIELAKRKKPNI